MHKNEIKLIDKMLSGDRRSCARLITMIEQNKACKKQIMKAIYLYQGKAYSVGITGPAGAGKSSLVDRLIDAYRKKNMSVGVIAADPTSPFSGGALLGDRIRMLSHCIDKKVFIRSMATKGSHGGLPEAAINIIKIMDAFGKDIIFVETVGVGQTEVDVMQTVDTVVVTLMPEAGDSIQAMKAGLMEIADIFVVNKADREGAHMLASEIRSMLSLRSFNNSQWIPSVFSTQAINNVGLDDVCAEIERHGKYLRLNGELAKRRAKQRQKEFIDESYKKITKKIKLFANENFSSLMQKVEKGQIDPYSAAEIFETDILSNMFP